MDILTAIKREERKLEKQLGNIQQQLNGVRAAAKALGDSTNRELKERKLGEPLGSGGQSSERKPRKRRDSTLPIDQNICYWAVLFMTRYRRALALFAVAFASITLPLVARPHAETWVAWVSDYACGARHSEPGHADCIRKCIRGGAAIGHPEWKSQPLVLVKESDRSVWIIENPSSLSGLEGQRVRADVEINAARKAVHVKRVAGASERNP